MRQLIGPFGAKPFLPVCLILWLGSFLFADHCFAQALSGTQASDTNWAPTGSLNVARAAHTATLLPSGKVLVAGGHDNSGVLDSAKLYDPATGTWAFTGPLVRPRYGHTATLLANGQVLVVGGEEVGAQQTTAELYDPATGKWSQTGSVQTPRWGYTATLLQSGKVLVAGGSPSRRGRTARLLRSSAPSCTTQPPASGNRRATS